LKVNSRFCACDVKVESKSIVTSREVSLNFMGLILVVVCS
jgi:hypothetical protein